MKKLIVISLLLFSCSTKPPQPYESPPLMVGQDYLGLLSPNFNVTAAANALPKNTPIGFLDWTFSSSTYNAELLLSVASVPMARVHLFNTVCVRNQNCGKYEPGRGYTKASLDEAIRRRNSKVLGFIRTRTEIYKELAGRFETRILVSPALEHDLSEKAWKILADTVHDTWPEVTLVNNPGPTGWGGRYRNCKIERHGNRPPGDTDINSLDGTDVRDINVKAWLKTPGRKMCWTQTYNCRVDGPFIDPRKRTKCPRHFDTLIQRCNP